MQPELSFDTYILRPFHANDYKNFFELIERNRSRLSKYFPATVRSNQNIEATKQYITGRLVLAEKLEFISFVITHRDQADIIGVIFLKSIEWSISKAEIGFYIDQNFEGKGIISKGVQQVVKYAFHNMKVNKLFMRVGEDNPGSKRVAEKNGFRLEGKLRNDFKAFDGSLVEVYYYGLIPSDLEEL